MKTRVIALVVVYACAAAFCLPLAFARDPVCAKVTATAEAGGRARVGQAEISIPPGAVRAPTEITLTMLSETEDIGDGLSNVTAGATGYRFEPKGMTFELPVEVRIGYDPSLDARPEALEDLYTYFYDEREERWKALERIGIDRERSTLVSATTHFTDMVNAALTLPEAPDPVSFNVNSIKSLAAADPNAGIPEFRGLGANPFGTASFDIPLEVPGGRAGMKPAVALAYSSEGGANLAGKGFDLRAGGCLSIDTRNRLPSYDYGDEYILDGEKLEEVPGQSPSPGPRSAEIEYRHKSNRNFERIVRKRAVIDGVETTYWTVTDKTGRKRVYGLGAGWTGPDESRKYEWKLSREIDAYGNAIDYSYDKRSGENFAYLARVSYTGRARGELQSAGDEPGPYAVDFSWTETRRDKRSSFRGKFLQRTTRELRSVTMSYAGTNAWSYGFEYDHNENRHLILRSIAKNVDGREFWNYGFEYYGAGATAVDADVEVDGFDDPIDWAIPDRGGRALSKTGSSGGGASLYLGLKFYIPYIFGRYVVASVGASVGAQTTVTGTKTTLIDIDGDGLSDMVWQTDAGLEYARNAGIGPDGTGSFDDAWSGTPLFPLTGKSLNKESQTTYSLSFSESLGPAAANLTEQWSETSSRGVFADVDGDGFVDYLTSDDTTYQRNSVAGFGPVDWTDIAEGVRPSALFGKNRETFERTYYSQEPYLVWRPAYAGRVVVTQRAALVEPTAASDDGASLDGYHAASDDGETSSSERFARIPLSRAQVSGESSAEREVIVGDRFFFHYDAGGSCDRDDAACSITVAYRSVRPFAYIGESSSVRLAERVSSSSRREELELLYDYSEVPGERGVTFEYALKPEWEESIQRDPGIATRLYLDGARSFPDAVPEDAFYALADLGSAAASLRFFDGRKIVERRLPVNRVLLSGFAYEGERGRFVRRETTGDLMRFVAESQGSLNGTFTRDSAEGYFDRYWNGLGDGDKMAFGLVPSPDAGEPSIPYRKGTVSFIAGPTLEEALDPRIDPADMRGAVVGESTFFRDSDGATCRVSGDTAYRTTDGREDPIDATVERLGDLLRVTVGKAGVLTVYALSGKTSQLASVDGATFDSRVLPVLRERARPDGESFPGLTEEELATVWEERLAGLLSLFSFDGAAYVTRDGLSAEERAYVAGLYSFCALARYASCATRFVYTDEAEFAVETAAGGATGYRVPVIRDGAVTSRWVDLPVYDSVADFSADDARGIDRMTERFGISSSSDADDRGDEGGMRLAEYARGGNKGWYYGLWSGYRDFDPLSIGKETERPRDGANAREPPYSRDIRKNEDPDGIPFLPCSARDPSFTLGTDVLIGDVSRVSDPSLDCELGTTVTETAYGSFYDGRRIHVERIGGTAYESAANANAGPDGRTPGKLGASASGATDVGVSVGIAGLGGQISENKGTSWQYKGLMDVNGDRFPDMIHFDDDCDPEKLGFSVQPGTGSGFARAIRYEGRLPAMSVTENYGHGFGVSLNPGGFASSKNDATGKQTELTVTVGGCGDMPSVGISGSYGRSVVASRFVDMNGDGLPDQVSRDGVGSFFVALNTGDGAFAEFENWGEGIDRKVSDDLGVSVRSAGVSTSRNSSVGLPVPVGFFLGADISVSTSTNETVSDLIDINGDGLPDQVYKRNGEPFFVARLNLGDSFDPTETRLRRPEWDDEEAMNLAIADSVRDGGKALTSSASGGLYDEAAEREPAFSVDVETMKAHPAARETAILSLKDVMESTSGVTYNVAISVDVVIRYYLLGIFITPGTSLNFGHTTSMMRFADIDGDGLPDHVRHVAGMPRAQVKRNALGTNGLLRAVKTPYGERVELEYVPAGNTVDMPQRRYVLGRVRRSSGFGEVGNPDIATGPKSFETEFSYEGGKYDRDEREFYGFRAVTERRAGDIGSTRTVFANDRYYRKGMVEETLRYRAEGELAIRTKYGIDARYPRVTSETTTKYDVDRGTEMTSEVSYGYEETDGSDFGNVTRITDRGDVSDDDDDYVAVLGHHRDKERYIVSPVTSVVVTGRGGEIRRREGVYTDEGCLESLTVFHADGKGATTRLTWDQYGNIASVTDPRGARTEYEYDPILHAFPVAVSMGGKGVRGRYRSRYEWNPVSGAKLSETDPGGGVIRYEYDAYSRLSRCLSPYDGPETPAVEHEYHPSREGLPGYAITKNKITHDPGDGATMETVVVVDPFRRTLATAKRGSFVDGLGSETIGWNVSGLTRYDEMGRAAEFGQDVFSRVGDAREFAMGDGCAEISRLYRDLVRSTTNSYDALDRIASESYPGGESVSYEYGIWGVSVPVGDGFRARTAEWTARTDENGNASVRFRDARGNVVRVASHSGVFDPAAADAALTGASFEYDPLGQMIRALDFFGNPVVVEYDMAGRRLSVESADSGRKEYSYDDSGNLVRESDSALRAENAAVHYAYDGLNRLVGVDYPFSEDAAITYGEPESGHGAGRKTFVEDESGTIAYSYGALGEVVRERRTIKRMNVCDGEISQEMRYEFDYLGRTRSVEYPDGEVVEYSYDTGGLVNGVRGTRLGVRFDYVRSVTYDEFGQRSSIEYGNGVRTTYEYDENRRWLSAVRTTEGTEDADSLYQNIAYGHDGVGNVTFADNDAFISRTRHEYRYDDLYRLTRAEGVSVSRPYAPSYTARYVQEFTYDAIGNVLSKESFSSVDAYDPSVRDLTYSFESAFEADLHPYRAIRSGDMRYRYDANGNLKLECKGEIPPDGNATKRSIERRGDSAYGTDHGFALFEDGGQDHASAESRSFSWNERNLMRSSKDARHYVRYVYGHDGVRAVKCSSRGETLYFNGMWQLNDAYDRDFRSSKHIYVGEARVATKCGMRGETSVSYESRNMYYYHPDHLGSVQLVTDFAGQVYERMEYAPYGETWIEEKGSLPTPFRFTGKEIDGETGLYYHGARYMDPKYCRWLSADPALGDYVPGAPVSDAARKRNNNLPGLGGLYNPVNFALYHYAANNPVRYVDPDGRESADAAYSRLQRIAKYQWPVSEGRIVSAYGNRADAIPASHPGIDIAPLIPGKKGQSVFAIEKGKVIEKGTSPGGSSQIFIEHGNGEISVYKHQGVTNVTRGDVVEKGQKIAEMGDAGSPGRVHLHFEIRPEGSKVQADAIDPIPKLPTMPESIKIEKGVRRSNGTLVN